MNRQYVFNRVKLQHRAVSAIAAILPLFSCLLYASPDIKPEQIDQLTQQWLTIERQKSQLQNDWQQQQPILQQRLAILNAERNQLQQLLAKDQQHNSSTDSRRTALLEQQNKLEQSQQDSQVFLQQLQTKIEYLAPLLPPVLYNRWQKEQLAIVDSTNRSAQLQLALAKLSKLLEFNQGVVVDQSAIKVSDAGTEKDINVKQLYLGASTAWFVSADQQIAGRGFVGEGGWQWQLDPEIDANEISRAIAMFEKTQQADFVRLPITGVLATAADQEGSL